jgi:hypothetical protein
LPDVDLRKFHQSFTNRVRNRQPAGFWGKRCMFSPTNLAYRCILGRILHFSTGLPDGPPELLSQSLARSAHRDNQANFFTIRSSGLSCSGGRYTSACHLPQSTPADQNLPAKARIVQPTIRAGTFSATHAPANGADGIVHRASFIHDASPGRQEWTGGMSDTQDNRQIQNSQASWIYRRGPFLAAHSVVGYNCGPCCL